MTAGINIPMMRRSGAAVRLVWLRTSRLRIALIALLLILTPQLQAGAANRAGIPVLGAETMATTRLRIGVLADGIVRITPSDLAAAGINPASVDPRTFAMSSLGRPTAIRVAGESDGQFQDADRIEFFGQRFRGTEMEEKYTDERVYWLDMGGAAGPRIADVDATPQGDLTPPADFPTTLHAEDNTIWWSRFTTNPDTLDTWFWQRLTPVGAGQGVTATLPYTVPHPAQSSPAALRLVAISRTEDPHYSTIALNGAYLGGESWSGFIRKVFTVTVPSGWLVNGINTVTTGSWNQPGQAGTALAAAPELASAQVRDMLAQLTADFPAEPGFDAVGALGLLGISADDIFINYWELNYRRLFLPWEAQLDFLAEFSGTQEFLSTQWPSGDVSVWDVSNPLQPTRLTGAAVNQNGGEYAIRFRATPGAGDHFWLQSNDALSRPASIRLRPATSLRDPSGGADAVIVTHASLRPAAEALAGWHLANGRRAVVADVQDVYDEFNEGIFNPEAVPAMLAWAQTHWASPGPRYLTLVGDGHWNFKNFNTARYSASPQLIPPVLAWVDLWAGEVPVDGPYGDLNSDGLPEIAVGRLAVNTLDEAWTVVSKITSYDDGLRTQPWQRRAVFVADRPDSAGDYARYSDAIIGDFLPADMTPQRIYLGVNVADAVGARMAITSALNAGAYMMQYTGHGSISGWSRELILTTSHVAGLTNGGWLPLIMTFNCLDGYYAYPGQSALAEVMQRHAGGGSVAAISPTGLGLPRDHDEFRRRLMDELFNDNVTEIGQALVNAKLRFYAEVQQGNGTPNYLIPTIMLYGDPAMRIPQAARRMLLPIIARSK